MAFLQPKNSAPIAPLADQSGREGWAGPHSTGLTIALKKSAASMRMTFVSVTSGGSGSLGEAYVNTLLMQ